MPTKEWKPGELVRAADVNAAIQSQVVAAFLDAAARDAAIPAPTAGMVCTLTVDGRLYLYRNGRWAPPPGTIVRSGSQAFTQIINTVIGVYDVPPNIEDGTTFTYPVRVIVASWLYGGYGGADTAHADLYAFAPAAVVAGTASPLSCVSGVFITMPMPAAWDIAAGQNAGFKVRYYHDSGPQFYTRGGVNWFYVAT